jgi:hypothetical protein
MLYNGRRIMKSLIRILPVLFLAHSVASRAEVIVGPYSFEDAALIDDVVQVAGTTWDAYSNGWLDGTDSHPWAYTFAQLVAGQWDGIILLGAADIGSDMVFEARFTNNQLVNGPGADLVLFDAAEPSGCIIAIATPGGYTNERAYQPPVNDIGVENPYWWWGENGSGLIWLKAWAFEIDLSDFGLAEGAAVSAFRFRGEGLDPLGAAALYSMPPVATRQATWGAVKALYR